MTTNDPRRREAIYKELETTRARFHSLFNSLSEDDFKKQSLNPGWTNGEILAHMTFGLLSSMCFYPWRVFGGSYREVHRNGSPSY
jgi:hypothetical protein